ncbi:hypothetical protein PMAYCL1PPCAC_13930, partial [Pristionchus mayeri]
SFIRILHRGIAQIFRPSRSFHLAILSKIRNSTLKIIRNSSHIINHAINQSSNNVVFFLDH